MSEWNLLSDATMQTEGLSATSRINAVVHCYVLNNVTDSYLSLMLESRQSVSQSTVNSGQGSVSQSTVNSGQGCWSHSAVGVRGVSSCWETAREKVPSESPAGHVSCEDSQSSVLVNGSLVTDYTLRCCSGVQVDR
jgi:hypothetical protein